MKPSIGPVFPCFALLVAGALFGCESSSDTPVPPSDATVDGDAPEGDAPELDAPDGDGPSGDTLVDASAPPEDLGDPARCAREPAQDLACARLWGSFHRDLSRAFACPSLRDARAISTACALTSTGAWSGYCCPSLGDAGPVPGAPSCASLPLVTLAREGRRAVVRGDTTLAWVQQTSGRPTAASQRVRADGADAGCAPMTGQLAFEYTVGPTASALAITTTNAGTDARFDTVLYVGTSCGATLSGARCNDDDARNASTFGPRRLSSYIETEVLPAATRVVVVVGGFFSPDGRTSPTDHGAFELTVDEVEFADEGAPCDVVERGVRCRVGFPCAARSPGAERGVCRRAGSIAGARCLATFPPCEMGLQCNAGQCASAAAIGAPCDLAHFCPSDSHCARATLGSEAGVCLRNGSDPGGACGGPSSTSCDTGLDCVYAPPFVSGACVRRSPIGGPCDARNRACVTGATCVTLGVGARTGLCAPNGSLGTLCNAVGAECAPGLTCFNQRCFRAAAVGDACDARALCPMGSVCVHADPTRPTEGFCRAEGVVGGPCQLAAVSACGAGLRCSRFDASGACESTAAAGAPCERLRTRCADGRSCVLAATSETVGECHPEGSPGAACRASGAPCDADLVCTGPRAEGGVCARVVAVGGACDPLRDVTRCAEGAACLASGLHVGACATGAMTQTEPDDAPAPMRAGVTAPTLFTGSLAERDVDCYPVAVPAGGRVLAVVSDGSGRCPAPAERSLVLDLYAPDGVDARGTAERNGPSGAGDCAHLDGASPDQPWAGGLTAGTWHVCVRMPPPSRELPNARIDRYVLSLSARAP